MIHMLVYALSQCTSGHWSFVPVYQGDKHPLWKFCFLSWQHGLGLHSLLPQLLHQLSNGFPPLVPFCAFCIMFLNSTMIISLVRNSHGSHRSLTVLPASKLMHILCHLPRNSLLCLFKSCHPWSLSVSVQPFLKSNLFLIPRANMIHHAFEFS